MQEKDEYVTSLNDAERSLGSFINVEAHCNHGNDLDVSNGQSDPEASEPSLKPDCARRFSDSESASITDCTADLHPPTDDLNWV